MTSFNRDDVLAAMAGRFTDFYGQWTTLRPQGREMRGPCPLHKGDGPNFSVNPRNGLWKCFTGCKSGGDVFSFVQQLAGEDFSEALEFVGDWLGIAPRSAVPMPHSNTASHCDKSAKSDKSCVANTYDYTDEVGTLLFQAVRYEPKGFKQRRPNGQGGWIWQLGETRRVLYRLPEVLAAVVAGKPVYFCEGEKDADALAALGLTATTAPMGAMKKPEQWEAGYTEALRGASVVILPDNDQAGRDHAVIVAKSLHGQAKHTRIVNLPDLLEKGDVSDWLEGGYTVNDLSPLVKGTSDWQPNFPTVVEPENDAISSGPAAASFPKPDEAMFYGLLGEYVQAVDPHTEADRVAVLVSLLVGFGIAIDRQAFGLVGHRHHHGNLFAVLVGDTASGKGNSWDMAKPLLTAADPAWASKRLWSGLSSGEGLIHSVRDAVVKQEAIKDRGQIKDYQEVTVDEGESDKRLLVIETEFARVLTVAARDNNTLSAIMRQAWDGDDLKVMTKEKSSATAPHLGILGHITPADLKAKLTATDSANGFANRFLWICVRRSKLLPEGGELWKVDTTSYERRLTATIEFSRQQGQVQRDEEARAVWGEVYGKLTAAQPGLVGAIISRGGPIVLRLSLLYALLDQSNIIRRCHLEAALALWDYAEASARYIFGNSLGDPVADALLRFLKEAPDGLTRTDIRDKFGGHKEKDRIDAVLLHLQEIGQAYKKMEPTGGRSAERWFCADVK